MSYRHLELSCATSALAAVRQKAGFHWNVSSSATVRQHATLLPGDSHKDPHSLFLAHEGKPKTSSPGLPQSYMLEETFSLNSSPDIALLANQPETVCQQQGQGSLGVDIGKHSAKSGYKAHLNSSVLQGPGRCCRVQQSCRTHTTSPPDDPSHNRRLPELEPARQLRTPHL